MSALNSLCRCCGAELPKSSRLKIKVTEAILTGALPFSIDTVYGNRRTGRWPWLTRTNPDGRVSKNLWIVVPDAAAWFVTCHRPQPKVAASLFDLAQKEGGSR